MKALPLEVTIRAESPEDAEAIHRLIASAFEDMPYADGNEAELVDTLRSEAALVVSLVAECDGKIVGQIAFSPARTADESDGWYALGPVSVLPSQQGRGVGSRLVVEGLGAIGDLGAQGCILTGNPAFYRRFGFAVARESAPPGEPAEFFMVKTIRGELPRGPIDFHEAFHADD